MGEVGKLFPLRDSLKFPEFADAIRGEFGIREWDRLSLRHGEYFHVLFFFESFFGFMTHVLF